MSPKVFTVLTAVLAAGGIVVIILGLIAQYWPSVILGGGLEVLVLILRASASRSGRTR